MDLFIAFLRGLDTLMVLFPFSKRLILHFIYTHNSNKNHIICHSSVGYIKEVGFNVTVRKKLLIHVVYNYLSVVSYYIVIVARCEK